MQKYKLSGSLFLICNPVPLIKQTDTSEDKY